MVKPVKQRRTNPQMVLHLWNAVQYIRQQKQIPNVERIGRYMLREHEARMSETEQQLQYAVQDGLLDSYTAVGSKGSKTGIEQEGFRVPDAFSDPGDGSEEEGFTVNCDNNDHDWYCFECHKPGEVLVCGSCWRVYHPSCTNEDITSSVFVCVFCKIANRKKCRFKRKEINTLLSYTIARLKEKTRELHRIGGREEEEKFKYLMFMPMDLNTMENKIRNRRYRYLEDFVGDAHIVLHNTFICYGDNGIMADLAKIMIKDCKYDIDEIRQCRDCYHYSNSKPKDWFCQPCKPPHELVYAKQKGFSYWPAKVIRVTAEGYDVRFFGGWHQRAVIPPTSVKPISTNIKTLAAKRTSSFVKACDELHKHQTLVEEQALVSEDMELSEEDEEKDTTRPVTPETTTTAKKTSKSSSHLRDTVKDTVDNSAEAISSSYVISDKPARTPEDSNLVTSSQDNIQVQPTKSVNTNTISTQTSKKLMNPSGKLPHKSTQTDLEVASTNCKCETKYNKLFSDYKAELEKTHKSDKDEALKEFSEQLHKDFEEDKQQAVARAMANMQKEIERVKRQTEEKCKEKYMEEMRKLAQKHKEDVSLTKKKQWCYNCEDEAMYHCCWNTAYCSIKCQQEHWHKEHKRVCRRKR